MNKGKKFVSLFLVFSLLAINCATFAPTAREKRAKRFAQKGAQLIVQKIDGLEISGELIAVKENSLLMLVSGVNYPVDIGDVSVIKVKKSKALMGSLLGLISGAGVGYAIPLITYSEPPPGKIDLLGPEYGAIYGALIGGFLGLIIGGVIGGLQGKVEAIRIEGKSPEEVKEALEELRSEARIPDYE